MFGVWLGAALAGRRSERNCLREKRADAYVELLDLLTVISQTFHVGLKVSKLRADAAREHGHDFEGVEQAWRSQLDDLEHVELRVNMLGGRLGKAYQARANDIVFRMLQCVDATSPSETEWDLAGSDVMQLRDDLVSLARADLGASWWSERLRGRVKRDPDGD